MNPNIERMPQELKRLAEEYIEAQRGWDLRESLYPRTAHVALDKLNKARSALLAALTPERVVALCEFYEVASVEGESHNNAIIAVEAAFAKQQDTE